MKVFQDERQPCQQCGGLSEMEKSFVSGAEGFQKWKKVSSAVQKVFRNGKKSRQRRRRFSEMEKVSSAAQKAFRNGKKSRQRCGRFFQKEKSLVSGAESKEIVIFNQYQHEGS